MKEPKEKNILRPIKPFKECIKYAEHVAGTKCHQRVLKVISFADL